MTSNVMPSIIQIEEEKLKQLVTQVRETIANEIDTKTRSPKNKKFGIVDMWKCQRNVRTAVSMRRY